MDSKRLERIEDKVDKVQDAISRIDVTLAKQHTSLEHHIARTDALEAIVNANRTHVSLMQSLVKLGAAISAVVAFALAIKTLLS